MAQSEVGMRVSSAVVVDSTPGTPKVVGMVWPQYERNAKTNVLLQIQGVTMILPVSSAGFAQVSPSFVYKSTDCSGTPYLPVNSPPTGFVWRPVTYGPQSAIYLQSSSTSENFTALSQGGEGICSPLNQAMTGLFPYQVVVRLNQIFTPPFSMHVTTF
jgi:hypothetical protein